MTSAEDSVSRTIRRVGPISYFVPTFDAQHLLERVHDLDEIGLVRHHLVDVLVGAGDLVQHALVLAADDAFGLRFQVLRPRNAFCAALRLILRPAPCAHDWKLSALPLPRTM